MKVSGCEQINIVLFLAVTFLAILGFYFATCLRIYERKYWDARKEITRVKLERDKYRLALSTILPPKPRPGFDNAAWMSEITPPRPKK